MSDQVGFNKIQPIWQETPDNVKGIILQYLSYTDRCNLRRCSKNDKFSVDRLPIYIKELSLKDMNETPYRPRLFVHIRRPNHYHSSIQPLQCAVKSFFKIVGLPNVKIELLVLDYYEIPLLHDLLHMRKWRQIAVETVHFKKHGVFDECVLNFIKHLSFRKCIIEGDILPNIFNALIGTEQWRNAQGVHIPHINQLEVDSFLHLNSLRLRRERLTADDGMTLIQTYINKNTFKHTSTFFQVHTVEPMSPERILGENDSILKGKITNDSESDYPSIRVQQFKMRHSDHLVFVVKATPTMLAGSVCRPLPHIVDDFMDSPVI